MRNNQGFSRMELMTVIAIFSILAAIAIPGFIGWPMKTKNDNLLLFHCGTMDKTLIRYHRNLGPEISVWNTGQLEKPKVLPA